MKLDIGCGTNKRGDIGIDIERTPEVDVVASATHLPFRDNAFDEVVSYECIAYADFDPVIGLREALRVAKREVRIYTWDEPKFISDIEPLAREKIKNAYVPTFIALETDPEIKKVYEEEFDVNFFICLVFEKSSEI